MINKQEALKKDSTDTIRMSKILTNSINRRAKHLFPIILPPILKKNCQTQVKSNLTLPIHHDLIKKSSSISIEKEKIFKEKC